MTSLEKIKNKLINRIWYSENQEFLNKIDYMFTESQENDSYLFSNEQIELLKLSEDDIKYGNTISETELEELDKKWGY